MKLFERSFPISPEQYELYVRTWLENAAGSLSEFSANHRETIPGTDGEYEIDVAVRFQAMGVPFLVLVECKRYRKPVEREVVQVLYDRLRSVGAQKGILFSTSKFQSGALEYSVRHGIALIQLIDGDALIVGRSRDRLPGEALFPGRPDYCGMLCSLPADGKRAYSSIDGDNFAALKGLLGIT